MSDEFRRLLDDAPSSELRAVLESGLRDQPSSRTIGQAAQALGIGAAGVAAARAAAAASASRAVRSSLWSALAKWGAAGVLLGGLSLSPFLLKTPVAPRGNVVSAKAQSAQAVRLPSGPAQALPMPVAPNPVGSSSPAPREERAVLLRPADRTPNVPSELESTPSPAVQAPPRGAKTLAPERTVPTLPAATPTQPDSALTAREATTRPDLLDSEVVLLDSARGALKRGDSTEALALLDRHAQLGAHSLGAEATLLRVQALVVAGRTAEARAVARAALGGAPGRGGLAYAARLRKIAGLDD